MNGQGWENEYGLNLSININKLNEAIKSGELVVNQYGDVRIRKGKFEFQIWNSWGKSFGINGFAWNTWENHLSQPNRYHAFYLIRAARDANGQTAPEIKE